ncbi:MAG: histidine phosphatase family protein [Bryobacteraceae bacterium]
MSEPLELWIIRHGETEWSLSGQFSGRVDLPLTAHGEEEARATARALDGVSLDLVLCSPLQRARRTCEIAGYLSQARIEPAVAEWDYGDCTGFTEAQMRERFPGWTVWDGPIPGGESIEDVAARARGVISSLPPHGRVAVFSHGHFLRVLTTQFLRIEPQHGRHLALETGTLSILGLSDSFPAVLRWNQR